MSAPVVGPPSAPPEDEAHTQPPAPGGLLRIRRIMAALMGAWPVAWRTRWPALRGYVAAIGGVALASLAIVMSQLVAHIENISLLYLLVVLGLAAFFGRGPAIFASVLAFLAYDFFFIPPLYRLTVSDPTEWLSLLALLAASLVAGQLATVMRARAREARESEQRTATLYALAQLISKTTDEEALYVALTERVVEVFRPFGVEACAILLPEGEDVAEDQWAPIGQMRAYGTGTKLTVRALAPTDTPFANVLRLTERRNVTRATWAYEHGLSTGGAIHPDANNHNHNHVSLPSKKNSASSDATPTIFFAPLQIGSKTLGILAVAGYGALWRLMLGSRADIARWVRMPMGVKLSIQRTPRRLLRFMGGSRRWRVAPDAQLAPARALFAGFRDQIALAVERQQLAREAVHVAALRESDRMKNALLGTVTHDLRTPLASIRAATESLLEASAAWDEEQRRYFLETIHSSEMRLSHMVANLLDLSRLEAGAAIPQKQWYPIGDVISATLDRLDLIGVTAGRPIELDVPTDLPLVPLDHEQIEEVVTNLIENAVKYSPAGKPIGVSARLVKSAHANETGEIEVHISDQGEGIPASELTAIFDKFYRVQRGKRGGKQPGGAGLGLAICAAIIAAHGGRIWAESQPGLGSTFIFRLPIPRDDARPLPTEGISNANE